MTKLNNLNDIFLDFIETDNSKLIKYEKTAPSFISELYSALEKHLIDFYYKFKEAALNLGVDHQKFVVFEEKNRELSSSIVIGGGAISDFIISEELKVDYNPKDIDVFIQESLPEFICDLFPLTNSSKYWRYDLIHELFHLGFDVTSSPDVNDEHTPIGYILIAEVFKTVLDENSVEMVVDHFYNQHYIHLMIRGKFNEKDVELILSEDNKIFNFDLIFRSCYYTLNSIYCLDIALEDIKNKVIHIADANSPMTTLARCLYFEDKLGFNIEPVTFTAFLESVHSNQGLSLEHFISKCWLHPKCTNEVKNRLLEIFDLPQMCVYPNNNKDKNEPIKLKKFNNLSFDFFNIITDIKNCSIHFPKIKSVLNNIRNFSDILFTFKRPDDWQNHIFGNSFKDVNFWDWYRASFLFDNILPISDCKDDLFRFVTSQKAPKEAYEEFCESSSYMNLNGELSIFVKSDAFCFPITAKTVFELLFFYHSKSFELELLFLEGQLTFDNPPYNNYSVPSDWVNSMNNIVSSLPKFVESTYVYDYKQYL